MTKSENVVNLYTSPPSLARHIALKLHLAPDALRDRLGVWCTIKARHVAVQCQEECEHYEPRDSSKQSSFQSINSPLDKLSNWAWIISHYLLTGYSVYYTMTWATFFVQNKSQIPIHTCGCEKRERRITIHVGTVIWMVRKKWETGNEKTQFSIAKNLGGIWEFTRELWFRNYEKCAPVVSGYHTRM